jgi:magnesium chelatase subunit I
MEQFRGIQGLIEKSDVLLGEGKHSSEQRVAAAEFILEGLYAQKKISRNEERTFRAIEKKRDAHFQDFTETRRGGKRWN